MRWTLVTACPICHTCHTCHVSHTNGSPMRSAPSAVLLSVLTPLAVVALPVVSAPHPAPHPVHSTVRSQALHGVELAAVGSRAVQGSARAAFQAFQATGQQAAPGRTVGRPDVLVTRTHVASFDLLGVTWHRATAPADLTVLVRTHGHKGWTGWTALDVTDTLAGSEGKAARPGTEPLWVGDSDGYQVRVDVVSGALPRGLRVDLVDPGSSDADTSVGAGRPMQSAQAAVAQPQIFTRAQWGADESIRRSAPKYNSTIKAGFVHHTAGVNGYSEAEVPKILRGIYAYHVKGNGWSDIGYNFLVDRFGRLWEGRYGGMTRAVLGAHTGGFNVDSFAVSALGNYDKVAAPPVMVDSIARLMAWKLSLSYRDPNGTTVLTSEGGGTSKYRAGTKVTFGVISGHRDAGNTSCPGTNLYTQLATIKALTTTYLGTALLDPRPEPASAVYGSGASITTVARVTSDQAWNLQIMDFCRGTLVRTLTGSASTAVPVSAAWDLKDEAGIPVRPGAYTVTLASADATAAARPWVGQVTVQAARTSPPAVGATALPGRTSFVPVDPIKLYDTRTDGNLPLGPGGRLTLPVLGAGKVPATGVGAVALSIASSCATAPTTVTAWAAGSPAPSSPSLNSAPGQPSSALAVTPLGGNGAVSIANSAGTTELTVHVVGYYPLVGGQLYRPTKTLRLYDSRKDPAGILVPGVDRVVTMPALSGIPATAMTGVMLNVTTVSPTGTGTLTAQSSGGDRENATVSFTAASLVRNRAVVRLQDGTFKLTAHTMATHVVVDVVGWWAPAGVVNGRLFQPRKTARVLDTRTGVGAPKAMVGAGKVLAVKVAGPGKPAPAGVRAVVMNLTARDATRRTSVTAWPYGTSRPSFADLSVPAFRTTTNLVVVRVGSKGRVKITNETGSTNLVGDVVGYYP